MKLIIPFKACPGSCPSDPKDLAALWHSHQVTLREAGFSAWVKAGLYFQAATRRVFGKHITEQQLQELGSCQTTIFQLSSPRRIGPAWAHCLQDFALAEEGRALSWTASHYIAELLNGCSEFKIIVLQLSTSVHYIWNQRSLFLSLQGENIVSEPLILSTLIPRHLQILSGFLSGSSLKRNVKCI